MATKEYPKGKSDSEWKVELDDMQYQVLRESATERPFTGKFNVHFEEGTYHCAACKTPLFNSDQKFESGCGWPSFDDELNNANIEKVVDKTHGMMRTEIKCSQCGGHLGHVFNDGPTKTGLRYCVNSAAIDFDGKKD